MSTNPFATGYVEPKAPSKYLNFKDEGSYVFRILTPKEKVVTYFRAFKENVAEGESKKLVLENKGDGTIPEIPAGIKLKQFQNENPLKLVWAVVVFNQETKEVQILEISQQAIKGFLIATTRSKLKNDWTKFDVEVIRQGQKTETEYFINTGEVAPLTANDEAIINSTFVNLEAMAKGQDPFDKDSVEKVFEIVKDVEPLPEITDEEIDQAKMPF
jgi:hypothetical protein